MAFQVGYWTDLGGLQFQENEDGTATSTFMAMPYGEYDHPIYGKVKLTADKAANMVKNIVDKVRGTELDIDYDHKQHHGGAAGWVQAGEARENGLYLTVQWTKKAWEAIKAGEYKYFSPEFHDEWAHPKTKTVHKDVLFGGGITNRPFLKDILPLNMSELFEERNDKHEEGTQMDPKQLRKLLGLPEDATDDQVNEAVSKLPDDAVIGSPPAPVKEEDKNKKDEPEGEKQPIAASEGLPKEVIQLMEENPAVKALGEMVLGLQQTVVKQGSALQLAETHNLVTRLSEPQNNQQLSAAAQSDLKDLLLSSPGQEFSEKIVKFVEGLNKTGYVQLGEGSGTGQHGDGDGTDATKQFNEAVEAMVEKDKVDYGTAVERVASLQPDLFEAHRQASYAFKE